jgi:D-aspartate ligase
MKNAGQPLAVILGDIDMLRPLALAGIPCVVCAGRRTLPRYSRYARDIIEWFDPWLHPEKLVDSLMAYGSRQHEKPVLFYESDADLLMISRNRDRLSEAFRFVVPDARADGGSG